MPNVTDIACLSIWQNFHIWNLSTLYMFLVDFCNVDIRRMNCKAVFAKSTGMIILGGGLVKHHIANANLMVCNGKTSTCYVLAL